LEFLTPICPVYQNVSAQGETDPETIKNNLVAQLTSPVKWTQSVQRMITDGATEFIELDPAECFGGWVSKIDRNVTTSGLS